MIYCIVPIELADALHEALLEFWMDESFIEVVVERREHFDDACSWEGDDRRGAGRRPTTLPRLPDMARRHANRLTFVAREESFNRTAEERDTAALVTRFRAGEQAAFDHLYTRFFPRVYEHARSLLRDPHEAENVTQDVFAAALHSLSESRSWEKPLQGWLVWTTRNMAHTHRRKHGRLEVSEPNELKRVCEELSARAQANGQGSISEGDIWRLTTHLTAAQREVLDLRYRQDLSPEQIAQRLGCSRGSVDALQHRAIATLRTRLEARINGSAGRRDQLPMRALAWPRSARWTPGFSLSRAVA